MSRGGGREEEALRPWSEKRQPENDDDSDEEQRLRGAALRNPRDDVSTEVFLSVGIAEGECREARMRVVIQIEKFKVSEEVDAHLGKGQRIIGVMRVGESASSDVEKSHTCAQDFDRSELKDEFVARPCVWQRPGLLT